MTTHMLELFLVVAKEENAARAADRFHITPSVLSGKMTRLEKEVGARLFERDRDAFHLTSEGKLFQEKAREIVLLADEALGELSPKRKDLSE